MMIRIQIESNRNTISTFSANAFAAGTSSAIALSMFFVSAGLVTGFASPAAAQSTTKPVASCWATDAGRNYVRVSWTPANADNADRYTIKRSRNNGSYYWKSTVLKQSRSSIVTESNTGNLRYLVETISASGDRQTKFCGPDGGLDHDGNSTPIAVESCWATKLEDNSYFISWSASPDDGANRYTVMQSRNRGDYFWADTVGRDESESNFSLNSAGTYRFQVRTVARNGAYAVRDCGPDTGVTGVTSKLTVMPIGDSITLGATERPAYRYPMQEDARYKACGIDLVGSAPVNWARGEAPSGYYASFDHDHASWGGNTVGDLLIGRGIVKRVKTERPDVILLHVGTNDVTSDGNDNKRDVSLENESKPNLQTLINEIRLHSPDTVILVAKIIRPGDPRLQDRLERWNTMIEEVVASTGSKTRLVDMEAIWPKLTLGPVDQLTPKQNSDNERFELLTMRKPPMSYDGVHPSIDGSRVLSDQWLKALKRNRLCP